MKPINPFDQDAICEIARIQFKMHALIELAKVKEDKGQLLDALDLYQEAQHESYHVGEGPKVTIMNENIDRDNWHQLNNKIETLNKIIKC